MLNAGVRLVSNTKKFDRGLSRLLHTDLHWLDVPGRVQFELCMNSSMYAGQSSAVFEGILHIILRQVTVDSVFAQPAVTFLCHVIFDGPSLLLVRRRGTLPDDLRNLLCCDSYFGRFLKSILFFY